MKTLKTLTQLFLLLVFVGLGLTSTSNGQSRLLDLVRDLKTLSSDRNAAFKHLSEDTFSVSDYENRQTYYRVNENIDIQYSTGTCGEANDAESDLDLGGDIWSAPPGRIVRIEIEPKRPIELKDIGLGVSHFTKQKLYGNRKYPEIYFDKINGIALTVWAGYVRYIELLPSANQYEQLCPNDRLKNKLTRRKFRYGQPRPSYACVLYNGPGDVREVTIDQPDSSQAIFNITVKADDPENDVLTYEYITNAGTLTGVGSTRVWDLRGQPKGSYELKVAVNDGVGPRGQWLKRQVVVN